jgi:4-amino-4-deoxy-L-arabinose transferase-like glycosyltransferase
MLGLLVAAWQTRLRLPLAKEHQALLLWGAWLAPQVVFFSYAGLFHRYYLEMLSPAIAALVGAGMMALWRDFRSRGPRGWLLPLALVGSAAVEARILADFPDWGRWLTPLALGLCGLAAAVLAVCRCLPWLAAFRQRHRTPQRAAAGLPTVYLAAAACAAGFLALLIAPTAWALTPLMGGDSGLPFAGPELLSRPRPGGPPAADRRLSDYLIARQQDQRFLVATLNANAAAPFILSTGRAAMALGGFSGGDRILSVSQLTERVRDRQVRFFWLPAQPGQQADLAGWVTRNCRLVPPAEWQGALPGGRPANPGPEGQSQLYDCGP